MYHIYHCTQLVDSSFPSSDVGGTLFFLLHNFSGAPRPIKMKVQLFAKAFSMEHEPNKTRGILFDFCA